MKQRIIMLLLIGCLVVGLYGCGGSSGDSLPPEPVAEEEHVSMEVVEEVVTEDSAPEEFELEEPESTEVENEESTQESEDSSGATSGIDTSSLLSTYVIEFEDSDGYKIRETIQVSPIFTEGDSETMYALWETLGNDIMSFPSKDSLYGASHQLEYIRDAESCNMLEYVIGTFEISNLTEGFSITPDNPRSYVGVLEADGDGNAPTLFNNSSVSAIMYSNGTKYYGDGFITPVGDAKMESDAWGPRTFVIALPNGCTPNRPNGYRYDEIKVEFGNRGYGDSGCKALELTYYEE